MSQLNMLLYVLVWLALLDPLMGTTSFRKKQDHDELLHSPGLAGEPQPLSAQVELEPPVRRHVLPKPDWFIRRECRDHLDVIFVVSSEASNWSSRADIRDTLLEDRVKRTFKWAGAFVMQESREALVSNWIEYEGDTEGDLIVLPYALNASASATEDFRKVVLWALEHCAETRYVVKLADDIVVHPMLLHKFLRRVDETGMEAVYCDMRGSTSLPPRTDVIALAMRQNFLAGGHDIYCAGSVLLASLKLLRDLESSAESRAVSVSAGSHDHDGHGNLQIRNVAVGSVRNASFDANWNSIFVKLSGGMSVRKVDRYALWYSALWKDVLWNKPRFRKLLRGAQHANSVPGKDVNG
ncbi:hypothetical protein HPB50_018951 [Hyalomma asiaticum]|uniref:Uncharacterized protein n=1 Tax=Hyalomma asiaticum TaxID=266040 RepID=A0ACB7RPU0_HYAAI|nr:hypothetical protein HPB50_018951 [Hyalomma asiaticum]